MEQRFIFSVAELTRHIRGSLEPMYHDIWVEGEISNLRIPGSGHCYLTLKDRQSQLRVVMFKSALKQLRFAPEDGMNVICRGSISVYKPRGEYQLVAAAMEPAGRGELQVAFEQLKARLSAEGLFDDRHKKPLPVLPERIAVITSPTGAAVRDILKVIKRRFPAVSITVVPVRVQGEDAPAEIAAAFADVNAAAAADVIIAGRGGGSIEDLWAFNTEEVARAVFASAIPVVSAVGHEIDFTIADFVADLRAPTPSAAAELVVPDCREMVRSIAGTVERMRTALRHGMETRGTALAHLRTRMVSPQRRIADLRLRIDDLRYGLADRLPAKAARCADTHRGLHRVLLSRSPTARLREARRRLEFDIQRLGSTYLNGLGSRRSALSALAGRLQALSPLQVLARGFSIVRLQPSGRIVRDASMLAHGDDLDIRFHAGRARCSVTGTTQGDADAGKNI